MTTTLLTHGSRGHAGDSSSSFHSLWRFVGNALQRLAGAAAPQPQAVSEARGLRQLALTYLEYNPRYAADLFAAADRHEEHGGRAAC